jgi:hypothetical protein
VIHNRKKRLPYGKRQWLSKGFKDEEGVARRMWEEISQDQTYKGLEHSALWEKREGRWWS